MLRVTVDFIPKGNEKLKRRIARVEIRNTVTTPDNTTGDYDADFVITHANGDTQMSHRRIEGFERLRWNALGLVLAVLESLGLEMLQGGTHDDGLPARVLEAGQADDQLGQHALERPEQ